MTQQAIHNVSTPRGKVWLAWGGGVIGFAAVVMLLLVLAGVFHTKVPEASHAADSKSAGDLPLAEVRLVKHPRFETAVGVIKPVHESAVASKLLARVLEVKVKAGQAVTAGDVLVRLDDADLQARLKQAEASEAVALARRQQLDSELERMKKLFDKNAASKSDLDQAVSAMKGAASELQRAQQAVREANVIGEYATLRAPLSGIIVDKRVEPGDTVSPGQVLLTLYDPTRMQLVASVRESLAQRLTVGQTLPARLESLDHECEATVSEIVPEAAAASRSFSVKVTGPCPPGVYSGMFGRLLLPLEDEELVVVPVAAVRRVGQLTMVDVVRDGQVHRRHVQLGRELEDDFEVLSGLRPGERVVVQTQDAR